MEDETFPPEMIEVRVRRVDGAGDGQLTTLLVDGVQCLYSQISHTYPFGMWERLEVRTYATEEVLVWYDKSLNHTIDHIKTKLALAMLQESHDFLQLHIRDQYSWSDNDSARFAFVDFSRDAWDKLPLDEKFKRFKTGASADH
jgi:hypothetical protein